MCIWGLRVVDQYSIVGVVVIGVIILVVIMKWHWFVDDDVKD